MNACHARRKARIAQEQSLAIAAPEREKKLIAEKATCRGTSDDPRQFQIPAAGGKTAKRNYGLTF
jgi:hypothetical protein